MNISKGVTITLYIDVFMDIHKMNDSIGQVVAGTMATLFGNLWQQGTPPPHGDLCEKLGT